MSSYRTVADCLSLLWKMDYLACIMHDKGQKLLQWILNWPMHDIADICLAGRQSLQQHDMLACALDPHQWSTYLDVGILFVLNSHDSAIISPGCHFKYVRHTVLCNDQAVVPSSQEGV